MQKESGKRELLDVKNMEETDLERIINEICEEDMKRSMNLNDTRPRVKTIKPTPGFCIKSKNQNNSKIFINICHSPELPKPVDKTEEELLAILCSDDPFSYRIPMSLGEPHKERDRSGNGCVCYDVIINTSYYEAIENNELFRRFFLSITYQGIEDKYGVKVDRETCIALKNKHYLGVVPEHHVRIKPLIAELGSVPDTKKPAANPEKPVPVDKPELIPSPSANTASDCVLRRIPAKGYPSKLVFEVFVPHALSSQSISVLIGEDRLLYFESLKDDNLDFFLPFLVNQVDCYGEFDVTTKVLTVVMPVVPDPYYIESSS